MSPPPLGHKISHFHDSKSYITKHKNPSSIAARISIHAFTILVHHLIINTV